MFDSALPVKPKLSLSSRKRRLEHTEQLVVDTPDSSPKSLSSYEIDELAQLFDEFIDESGPYKKNRLIPETSESIVAIPNASPPRILPPSTASATPNSTRPATKSNPDTSIPLTKATIEIDGSPHAHQPSPPPIPRAPPPKVPRKLGSLENVFTEDQVRSWSAARIHAWNIRHTNPEAYYYRFVDPTEGQFNGGFKRSDHD
ncbi:hypothetical protein BJ085DRAFT_30613 [Dimargaris cristalligena]|uniref:Uncharacterized protein n=1 Tax=Dimargaris cristalligena TaxID=215637 RepID=A0A4P9ZZY8_9FUNG|nr:hypothetical protein BJ085DRAFT_30613 [Dimargaris cristalligena]|eukprot:RKP38390.1 hypothetical protein BJ085DRAFT_30613 [Dimargaris cristalligena]